ncbi:MAG: hypothetical protein JKY96_05070 [Phycisphaerales bacterium]|nr:hypothetical protein [Phycisphaerales bacterium]
MRTHRPMRAITQTLVMTVAISAPLLMSGCFIKQLVTNSPGGQMRTTDTYTYVSSPFEPLSVTLYDNRDKEPLWTVDVPVGQKVTIRFLRNKSKDNSARRPDIMQWEIYPAKNRRRTLSNTMAVPPADSRLLKVALRDGPEYPVDIEEIPEFPDPKKQWDPVKERKFRGVSTSDANARSGSYYAD